MKRKKGSQGRSEHVTAKKMTWVGIIICQRHERLARGGSMNRIEVARVSSQEFESVPLARIHRDSCAALQYPHRLSLKSRRGDSP